MKAVLATYGRELRAYFLSPLAYVVLFFFLAINGLIFYALIGQLSQPGAPAVPPMSYFFTGTGLMLLILGVVLTMRLLSEELKSGSIEVLMTAPVTEGQVVAGKYLAALTFFAFLWLPTVAYPAVIAWHETVDWGPVASGYLGILLVGALFLSVGTFVSATTRSQLVAAMVTSVLLFLLFLLGWIGELLNTDLSRQVFGYLDLGAHMDEFSRGIVDTRRLVYYLSAILFFLFLASRALEDKKWR